MSPGRGAFADFRVPARSGWSCSSCRSPVLSCEFRCRRLRDHSPRRCTRRVSMKFVNCEQAVVKVGIGQFIVGKTQCRVGAYQDLSLGIGQKTLECSDFAFVRSGRAKIAYTSSGHPDFRLGAAAGNESNSIRHAVRDQLEMRGKKSAYISGW